MKIIEKVRNFIKKLEISQKYRVFQVKKDFQQQNFQKFLLNKLQLKYFVMFWFYHQHNIKELGIWSLNIIINGGLIYVAYTGLLTPLNMIHKIIAFGLTIYIPTKLVTKAYDRMSLEHKMRARPNLYPQEIKT